MKILCSAIHVDDGKKYVHQPKNIDKGFVICGRRHHNAIYTLTLMEGMKDNNNKFTNKFITLKVHTIQGFLTDTNLFVNRKEAFKIAKEAKQINGDLKGSILTSEDLW